MKILVTGREGQVARSLAMRGSGREETFVFVARPDFDLARPETIVRTIEAQRPDVIVSAAAYTAVDKAEDEPDLARQVNAEGPGVLARAASATGARIIHLSTDYVFDGSGEGARREEDATSPVGVYGSTKLEGEEAVRTGAPENHVILRTAWVYSPFGNNFVRTMLRLAAARDEVSVVDDQHGNPTSALDIVDGILAILDRWKVAPETGLGKTYHLAGTGEATWCEFARKIFSESGAQGGPSATVLGISSADYPTKARRPLNSRLDCRRFALDFGWRAPDWRRSVVEVLQAMNFGRGNGGSFVK